jgi:hypothetical protein
MTKPKSSSGDSSRKVVRIIGHPGDDPAELQARSITRPTVQAAATIQEFADRKAETELTVNALIDELQRHCDAANSGNLACEEAMLVAQAHTLDTIFNTLARRATGQEYLRNWETFMRLALKAQSQCRTTIETLAAIKNPQPVAFVKQANIAAGPQQVNNVAAVPASVRADAHAREIESTQTKLSGPTANELCPDSRASALARRTDPQMATVGEIHRTKDGGG